MNIEDVSSLARLKLKDEEKGLFEGQLNKVMGYIDTLNELDTGKVAPTSHVLPLKNVFRDDEISASLPREKILQNAPESRDGFFRVPKIIE
ncbi:MAG: Asp-tRNA(Asn)/Glu-tRNA(Gln) amidotransferase subunit GatC [Thermodesulfovibrionia bacterium]|nr:Asp-tRNA(Asn)/Glu-tRNA(Gln) amidotransferase subunit GatC [Thermodesulfovibrionia bacterium]